MRVAGPVFLLIAVVFALTACATCPPQPTRTEVLRVPQPVWEPIPERYIQPIDIPGLPEPLTNEALETDTSLLESLIERYESDRTQLRRIQQRRSEP